MSATEQVSAPSPAEAASANRGLPAASLPESLAVVVTAVLPALVRGLFSPRRGAMRLLTRLDADRRTVAVLSSLRRKYDGEGIRLLGGKLTVLWGEGAIREVLDRSAELYAGDSGAKAKGMSHFQPDALTLSRGVQWRDRRAFADAVLASSERIHPSASRFLAVVDDEVRRLSIGDTLVWEDWERLFDRITLRIIFGDQARDDQRLTALLEKLMGEANRLVGLSPGDDYYEFYGAIERHLRSPGADSLIARIDGAPVSDRTRVVQQIPHWIFAMRDTLGANTFRALAAMVADPALQARVRDELDGADLRDPGVVDGLRFLEGCLHEAMRLWPTTPLLARETTRETTLAGERLEAGAQVMLLNVFNHRNAIDIPDAEEFRPERWAGDRHEYRFNHLSNGAQDCPGGPLVLLLGKAAIAQVLAGRELQLERPRLDPAKPLPHMLDFYETRFTVSR